MLENLSELKTKKAKRIFAFTAILLLTLEIVLLVIVHHYYDQILEPYSSILKEVLINLIAASLTAIFITGLLIFLLPIEEKSKSVEIIDPSKTKALHDHALINTDFWYHHGQIGRWVRTTAMPALAKVSVDKSITTTIKLIILNPKNENLCNLYAEFRNRISFKENNIKTIEDVQAELIATIIIGQIFEQSSNGLNVQVFLDNQLALVREDVNAQAVFRTQVDPRCSAIVYYNLNHDHEKSEYYNIAKTDFDFASRCCDLLKNEKFPDGDISIQNIKQYLTNIDLLVKSTDSFLTNILNRVKSDYHPYN